MRKTEPDSGPKPLQDLGLRDFMEALGSAAKIPGAGAASGIALALAASCAAKAVAISLRHDASNDVLKAMQAQLADLTNMALTLAEADARQFKLHLEQGTDVTADALLCTDQQVVDDCRRLETILQTNAQHIAENMAGDWNAARALCRASRVIQEENLRELKGNS